MMKKTLCVLALGIAAAIVSAKTIYVSADSAAGGNGDKDKPFSSIQQGLDAAMPGDTVELAPGVYHEWVKFPRSGKFGKPIRLNGPRTAIIDGVVDFKMNWKKIPQYGPYAWHTKVPAVFFPKSVRNQGCGLIIAPDGLIIQLFEKRVKDTKSRKNDKRTTWYAPSLMTKGIGKSGFSFIKALGMYRHKKSDVIVAFGDGRDVSKVGMKFAPPIPSITIDGVDRCVVSGITIRHSYKGVLIKNSVGSVVEDCRILRSDRGVELAEGSDRCTVRFCEISMDSIFRANPRLKGGWEAWQGHKRGGYWDRIAINIVNSVGGHQIHDNYLHNHWGGVQDCISQTNPKVDYNICLNVHHNRIDEIEDDGLEPTGGERECRWHHNYVTRSRCGFRIKNFYYGPMYAYANVFFDNTEDFRNFRNSDNPEAICFVYHNTSNTKAAVNNNKVAPNPGVKNFHYFNNIFVCDKIYGGTDALNWQDAGNVYICRTPAQLWQDTLLKAKNAGFKSSSKFIDKPVHGVKDFAKGDFSLNADSPAIKAGIDLSKYALPGVDEFKNRDAGAVESGKPMFKTYRKKSEVKCPEAGFWPAEGSKLTLKK
ncbi:MAG: hypothetical protein IJC21_04810 [Lentisphaeria bacterium]|nr:hypothetical protein [Lentisphaeria bacterium]